MWSCDQSLQFYERSYRKLFSGFDQKNTFFEGWSWFKFNNLGLALGIALEFYTGLATLFLKNRNAQRPTISPKPYWVFPQISLEQ